MQGADHVQAVERELLEHLLATVGVRPRPAAAAVVAERGAEGVAQVLGGLVALEAQASGVPVLASASGGLVEAVNGQAVLLSSRDPLEWAERLDALLDDDALWEAQSAAGIRFAAERSWDRTAEETVLVYRELLEHTAHASWRSCA